MSSGPSSASFAPGTFYFGADYNPEQWDRATWLDDVRLMQEANVTMVAVNIFGWAQIEPEPGTYRFEDLDAILDLLHEHGIAVNLGTGTATPPPWLSTQYPDILPVTDDGTRLYHGGRQAWCPSSPVYRQYARHLVERVAERYGQHPAVALWHVSNELGCHNALCYCDISAKAFRLWLRNRYGTIDELNRVWGTSFWSQRYHHWDEVIPPRQTPATANPGQQLDFKRFSSDELLQHYLMEREVIRQHSTIPVTTNFMITSHIRTQDYWAWAPEMDLIANDHYFDHRLPDPLAEQAFCADLTRGLAGGKPWFLMESATSAVNWQPCNIAKRPGELLRDSLAYVARGADAVSFFQWRASVFGSEKFHSAMVSHAGTASPQWAEVRQLGEALTTLSPVIGSTVHAQIALVFDWQAWWACDLDSHPSQSVEYLNELQAMHRSLRHLGYTVDIVSPEADLSGYRLVLVATLYLTRDATAERITEFVRDGGVVAISYFSGIVDEHDHVRLGGYPGAFRDLIGAWSDMFYPVPDQDVLQLDTGGTAQLWTERLHCAGATVVARTVDGPLPDGPVITQHHVGEGQAWYIATSLDDDARNDLLLRLARESTLDQPVPGSGHGVDVIRRQHDNGQRFAFVLNTTEREVTVALHGRDLLTGSVHTGSVPVTPRGVRVILEEGASA